MFYKPFGIFLKHHPQLKIKNSVSILADNGTKLHLLIIYFKINNEI